MTPSTSQDGKKSVIPLLVNGSEAAELLGIRPTTWYTLKVTGKLPRPVTLGRREMWVRNELLEWIEAGCPAQTRWEQAKTQKKWKKH